MKNIKLYLIGFVILLFFAGGITIQSLIKKNKRLKADNERISENNRQMMSDKLTFEDYLIKEKEVAGRLKRERDSLASALKVKPKQIQKIVYVDNWIRDTIRTEVRVGYEGRDFWTLTDSSKCFRWEADVYMTGDSLNVWRTEYFDKNRITETFYRKRPHKILFIKFGKWVNLQEISATCGTTEIRQFQFIK